MRIHLSLLCIFLMLPLCLACQERSSAIMDQVSHGYAENEGVNLHYVSIGEGPLMVMLHGFPDYWYTWRDQMMALKDDFQVVAMDLRGYNLSGQPEAVEAYQMKYLVQDVIAVIQSLGREKAIIVGHDWGGAIAWQLAIQHPEVVEKLIVCNMTHPTGRSIASLQALQANGNNSYMDEFRQHTAETLPISWLSGWVQDAEAKKHYEAAFQRSSIDGMIHYYRANTATKAERAEWLENGEIAELPKVQMPVLAIFGTQDQYVSKDGLNNSWNWIEQDFTLVTIPDAGHFVQHDASEMVSKSMSMWLLRDESLPNAPQDGPLADLTWLLGSWERTKADKSIFEEWEQQSPTVFKGKGYVVAGGDTSLLEEILITQLGNDIFYIPKVSENAFPIPFKLIEQKPHELTFENATHDFPQRIHYRLLPDGSLNARVGDLAWKKEIPFHFRKK